MSNIDKTLQELDGEEWGDATFPSHLATECHRLRRVPLKDFSTANLRMMIGQGFCLEYLMPIAIDKLEENPFVSGDFYKGDLLQVILNIEEKYWKQNTKQFERMVEIKHDVEQMISTVEELKDKLVRFEYDGL